MENVWSPYHIQIFPPSSTVYELLIQVRVADGEGPHAIPTKTFGRTFAAIAKGELSNKGFTQIDNAAWAKLNQKN